MDQPPPLPVDRQGPAEAAPGPWGFWATIFLTAAAVFVMFAAQAVVVAGSVTVELFSNPDAENLMDVAEDAALNGAVLALAGIIGVPPAIGAIWCFIYLRRDLRPVDYMGLRDFPIAVTFGWLIVLGVYQLVVAGAASVLQPPDNPTAEFMMETFKSSDWKPLIWFGFVIVVPVGEEFVFRGFMFRGLLGSPVGAIGAVCLTAVVWGAIHIQYDLFGIASLIGMGIILGLARLASGSTWTPVALHVAWNGIATAATELYIRGQI